MSIYTINSSVESLISFSLQQQSNYYFLTYTLYLKTYLLLSIV